jgi:hypothetical protein
MNPKKIAISIFEGIGVMGIVSTIVLFLGLNWGDIPVSLIPFMFAWSGYFITSSMAGLYMLQWDCKAPLAGWIMFFGGIVLPFAQHGNRLLANIGFALVGMGLLLFWWRYRASKQSPPLPPS